MHQSGSYLRLGLLLTVSAFLTACATVSLDEPKEYSTVIEQTDDTYLARQSKLWRGEATDTNGFYPLTKGKDAFGTRLSLMNRAEVSIDVQYFLMKPDDAGLVFTTKLLEAADRGVRVRFLLDDIFTEVDDVALSLIDSHPNVELRLFNPIARKGIFALNYAGNFKLTNRRMHNKSFTVDNQVSVVGGRNIAVEYFQLETTGEFKDFDMLVAGPIVNEVSASFDDYWNHKLAVPFEVLDVPRNKDTLEQRYAEIRRRMAESGDSIYADVLNTDLMKQFYAGQVKPFLADAQIIVDEPDKLLNEISPDYQWVAKEVGAVIASAEQEVIIFTPYFIPSERGVNLLADLSERGVRIKLITNSLATNNHTPVHSAYTRHRKAVLEAGVELWEARADAAKITAEDGTTQLEKLTLHTKGIVVDRKQVFVGSLNLDPRSIDINTEMGLLVDSPEMAGLISDAAERSVPGMAYRVKMDESGNLSWHAMIDGKEVVETKEPQTSGWKRFESWFMKIAPEKQL